MPTCGHESTGDTTSGMPERIPVWGSLGVDAAVANNSTANRNSKITYLVG